MRLDRSITLGLVTRFLGESVATIGGRDRLAGRPIPASPAIVVPILMYHSVSSRLESMRAPYYETVTTPARFADQMRWLDDAGWQGVTLSEALDSVARGHCSEKRPVAITFDDGFHDFHDHAAPILARHGFTATMYLPTAFIGVEAKFKERECLSWQEVRTLRQAGMEFGSHTVNHPKLVDLPAEQVDRELRDSKKAIEDEVGGAVDAFAYPYAFPQGDRVFARRFRQLTQAAAYRSCVTTIIGRATRESDPLLLPRLPVNDADDTRLFAAKVGGAYDWMAQPQRVFKLLRHAFSGHRR